MEFEKEKDEGVVDWRNLLRQLSFQEMRRLASILKVTPVTLQRWRDNDSKMFEKRVKPFWYALSDFFPQHRELLKEALSREFSISLSEDEEHNIFHIEGPLYQKIVDVLAVEVIQGVIEERRKDLLQQVAFSIDALSPGILLLLFRCTPSASGRKVRSLYLLEGVGTHPFAYKTGQTCFVGSNSLSAYSVMAGHVVTTSLFRESYGIFPGLPLPEFSGCAAAAPLLRQSEYIAGCLTLCSCSSHLFEESENLEEIQRLANLIALTLPSTAFFHKKSIEMVPFPLPANQQTYLVTLQPRICQELVEASASRTLITHLEAELCALRQIEQDILNEMMIERR